MKKIYLLLLFLISVMLSAGQELDYSSMPYAAWKEGEPIQLLKSAGVQSNQLKSASANQIKILLLTADGYASDVTTTLLATGRFSVVDLINYSVPTVTQLNNYDAVLVWADSNLDETIGDTLAAYIDGGGGVVSAVFNLFSPWGIETTRYITDYRLMDLGYYSSPATLGTINIPGHPIMDGVNSLNNPNEYRSNSTTMTPGSVIVAEWSDGLPLVVIKENVGPGNARRADVNIFPPSSNIRSDFWDASTDGGTLLANALIWVSGRSNCPNDITVSTDSSSCGVVVDYIVDTPTNGSLVQIAGLPTGTEFPVGTTTNCFLVTDSLGVESTCCFSITVVDSVAPVAECKSGGNGNVLLLWDVDNANTQSLKTALETEGYSVTMPAVPEYQWDNTNPPLDGFDAVIHLNGESWTVPLPLAAQNALVDFVNVQGKAFIHSEWDAFEIDDVHSQDAMSDITILQRYSGSMTDLTYTVVPGKESHQVLKDIPGSFTISYVGHSPTTLRSYATEPAEMLMTDQYGTAAVAIREFGNGKVVGFNHAGNYNGSDALTNNLVQQLYINALNWAAGGTYQLDKNGQVTITPADIDGGSTDNCGIASIELDRTQFTKVDIGEQTVTLTVTDNAGNSSTCQSTITIIEAADQKALCNPIDINLDADGTYKLDSLDMVEITGLSPDSLMTFDDMKIFAYPDTFTTGNIDWPVFVRITEYDQNYTKTRCWAMVTVHDLMPPTVVGKDIDVTLDSEGLAVITKEQVTDPATFDVSGIVSTSIDKDTFTCANIGENWVILSATDIYGNVGTDSVLVTVNSGLPALDAIPDVNITVAAGVCETTIEYPIPVINEICRISATLTAGLGHDGLFPVGTTTESWIIVNCKGDTTEVSFDVTVTAPNAFPALDAIADVTADEDAPEISVPVTGITYGNDCQVQTVTVVAETDNTALVDSVAVVYTDGSDAGIVKLTLAPDMSGTAKITVSVTDSEGATMFRSFNLVVNEVADTIANKDGNLATAAWTKEIETGINMYPNPTQDMVTIDIRNYSASQTEVAVFSITGSEVLRKAYPVGETIRFSMNEQVSGVYLVKMNIDGNHIIKKLVVDKK